MTCWLCGETTERVPTTPSCRNGPCQICIAVADIDEEINQAVAALHCLVAKRYDLLSEQNRLHDLLHRLPVELKSYTFQLALPTRDKWGVAPAGKSSTIVPSYLASICRNWRDIAWSTPSLWSTIRITRKQVWTSDPSWTKFLHDWILRSQTLPLTLRIDTHGISEEEWGRVLDVISTSSNRWHSLYLDAPSSLLFTPYNNNLQCDHLRRLQIRTLRYTTQPIVLLNSTMSPEEIDTAGLPFEALRISWIHLTSATVFGFTRKDITQLFQHASRMTKIILNCNRENNYQMPPVIHQSLKTLALFDFDEDAAAMILGSLTLPCLQDFCADSMGFLSSPYLPALVHRSSCPMTTISLVLSLPSFEFGDNLQPFPGVTDLVLDTVDQRVRLLLGEEYLPDLRRLTLPLRPFLSEWGNGTIRSLLDRIGSRPDTSDEGSLCKVIVGDRDRASEFDDMWNSQVGKELQALNIILREDGFEILA